MPSNKSLTETILSLEPKAEGLNDMSNAQLCDYLRKLRTPVEAEAEAEAEDPTPKPVKTYKVAPGRAITSKKGFLVEGDTVTVSCFSGGLEALLSHVKKGTLIES